MTSTKIPKLAAVAVAVCLLSGASCSFAAEPQDIPMDGNAEMQSAMAAQRKDPAWKPKYQEIALIQVGKRGKSGSLHNYCLNTNGNILACCGGKFVRMLDEQQGRTQNVSDPAEIRVFSPTGNPIVSWPMEQKVQAICVGRDGAIFAAGSGRILRLDQTGKVVASAVSPVADAPIVMGPDIEVMLKQMHRDNDTERRKMKEQLQQRRADFTGIAVTDQDVFVCVPTPNDFTFRVYRFDHDLKESKLIVEKLRGCCGQMDIQAYGGNLWVPHNARHRVECHDRDGKEIAQFGQAGRVKPQQFGGCCEPKNIRFTSHGDIIAAESGPPTCLKRFTRDGKFLGVLGMVSGSRGDCVRVTVEVSPDETRFYMLDTTKDAIHVFGSKS
jgi:hypothetical protein